MALSQPPQPAVPRGVVFHARDLSKTYAMGEVEVHALQGRRSRHRRGRVRRAARALRLAASRPCSTSSAASTRRPAARRDWRDHDLVGADDAELTRYRREHVGFVFQFYNLIPSLTARENVALVTEIADQPLDPRRGAGAGRPDQRLDHFPSQLSGGEQQRVAIARAIAKRPMCCSATSRPARSTTRPARWCWRPSRASTASSAPRPSSSPTTPRSRAWPTACCGSAADASSARSATPRRLTPGGGALVSLLDRKLLRDIWRHARPGDHDRAGGGGRHGRLRRFDIDLRFAACRRATASTRAPASRRSSSRSSARRSRWWRSSARFPASRRWSRASSAT